MARKPSHFTEHSNEEMHLRFKAAVAQLGQGVDVRSDRLQEIRVDGQRLGDRLAEMRKPGSTYYAQSYVEAQSIGMLMVDLGLADRVRDIRRLEPPAPDVEVCLDDNSSIFVEQTMVMDDGARRISMLVDDVNAAVRTSVDPDVRRGLDSGLLTIRLDRLSPADLELEIATDDLTAEVSAIASALRNDVSLLRPDPATAPILAELDARIFYRTGLKTGSPIQPPMDHGRPETVEPTLRVRLRKKMEKAGHYSAICRPLWLALDIDYHFGLATFNNVARAVIAEENPECFDRVIVQQARTAPLIIEL
jgi:hypothetical protein